MTPENPTIPAWAQRERQADFAWIQENLDLFWTVAATALEDAGRGAIVVATTPSRYHIPSPPSRNLDEIEHLR